MMIIDIGLMFDCCVLVVLGIIAFTNGVTGFNNSSSMHSTISEMRTNNISCWIFRAGSADMMDWGSVSGDGCMAWSHTVVHIQ